MPWPPQSRQDVHNQVPAHSNLSEEAFRRIQQVDQQSSTLTSQGITGFSARVLDRVECQTPDGKDVSVVQLIEIIKKPGQSLGLYLREGNGIDSSYGVFASRFGEGSELKKMGNIISPGDEILNVNNVEVKEMSIDDVVYALSIPRRLVLRTRFLKNRRQMMDMPGTTVDRPVIITQAGDSRRGSNQKPQPGILLKPTSTASTWLGKRARQQQQHIERSRHNADPEFDHESLPSSSFAHQKHNHLNFAQTSNPSVAQTAYVPPPKIWQDTALDSCDPTCQPQVPRYSSATLGRFPPPAAAYAAPYADPRPSPVHYGANLPYGPLIPPAANPYDKSHLAYKSNSLPRRRIQSDIAPIRCVKWRNDVISPGPVYSGRSAMSDIVSPVPSRRYDFAHMRANSTASSPNTARSMHSPRSVMDIFSAQEYRNWAEPYGQAGDLTMRRRPPTRLGPGMRSASLPSRNIIAGCLPPDLDPTKPRFIHHQPEPAAQFPSQNPVERQAQMLDRLHLSPLVNRRVPLRAAGPGFDVDQVAMTSLTGTLTVWILEGRNLRIPDKNQSNQLYVVLEIDEVHRARTGISTPEQKFRWREGFEIDVQNAMNAQFFVYSWHPQYRHRFCHKAHMKLVDALFVDQLNGVRVFALNLEPKGQLMVRVAFGDMNQTFRRMTSARYNASFGVSLQQLFQREQKDTPIAVTRLISEIEKRGVDVPGLYYLSGALERKNYIKELLNRDPSGTDLNQTPVPDINLLACLVKDFFKDLPESLVPPNIYAMLVDASSAILPADKEGNQGIMLKIVDCLPTPHKNMLVLLIDHIRNLVASEPHNGLTLNRACAVFGPLMFCVSESHESVRRSTEECKKVDVTDAVQASTSLRLLLDNWPSRYSSENSSLDESNGHQNADPAATLQRPSAMSARSRVGADASTDGSHRQPNGCVRFQVDEN